MMHDETKSAIRRHHFDPAIPLPSAVDLTCRGGIPMTPDAESLIAISRQPSAVSLKVTSSSVILSLPPNPG